MACLSGGSNAIGLFYPFLDDAGVELIGVEAGGLGVDTNEHAASLSKGKPTAFCHGNSTYILQNNDGQITQTHSISAGSYPGIGPEHSF